MDTEYADAIANYLRGREAAEAELKAADEAYRAETAALTAAADTARANRDAADHAAAEAATLVAETDKTVAVLWRALGGFVGHRRTGHTPYGHAAGTEADAAAVRARLSRAARLLDLARQGELPIEAPRHTEITAAAVGAAIGAIAVALAAWILGGETDGGEKAVRQALAAVTLFAGVATGPVALGAWLSLQYRVRPRPTQTVACVTAAVVATCALAGVFLRGM
ncbi:hypothetical protein L0U85_07575 [Glycomyces sp. L485]|uniref:hypothetical protein n=1 Tax=Glycomyces sp. L485 TaxID=2909235 RepID=UPI001F4B17BB|nr:hypothetical protein [Glycomyces sp. L485]MCH7230709.1 hypothetical protein [Glycomyces sp. L485]